MEMSLESSGQKKVLNFEEFTAAQQGGMMPPVENDEQPSIENEPINQEMPIEEPIETDQDEITLAEEPTDGPEADVPEADVPIDEPIDTPIDTPADESTGPVAPVA